MNVTDAVQSFVGKLFVTYENNPDFRLLLLRLSKNGLLVSGLLGITVTVIYMYSQVLMNDFIPAWSYSAAPLKTMVLWDKLLIIFISATAMLMSRLKINLGPIRFFFSIMVLSCVFLILYDDLMSQGSRYSTGYLTIAMLIAATCISFKPWQILTLCICTILILFPGMMILPGILGVPQVRISWSDVIYLSIISIIFLGISEFVYRSRYTQYMAKRSEDGIVESGIDQADPDSLNSELEQAKEMISGDLAPEKRQWVSEISVSSTDELFLEKVKLVIEDHMGDSNFGVEWLAHEVAISPRQLQRRLRASVGVSAGGLIRLMRLHRAAQLLEKRAGNVSEIAYKVGFQDPTYFSRIFRQMFKVNPAEYAKGKREYSD